MSSGFVTIATFDEAMEANIVKGRLEAEGIECFIADENIGNMRPLFAGAAGGIRLQVSSSDVERASELLRETEALHASEAQELEDPDLHCPNCGALSVKITRTPRVAIIVLSFIFLGGIPLLFMKRGWKCQKCGHIWRPVK